MDTYYLLREMFEVVRYNKILSPSKIRDTYSKVMHFLKNDQNATTSTRLGMGLHKDIFVVLPLLEKI